MDLASVVAALASVGVRVSGSTPNNNIQGDSSRACPTGLAGPEPSGTHNDPGQHFQVDKDELSKLMSQGTELAKEIQEIKRGWVPRSDNKNKENNQNDQNKDKDKKPRNRRKKGVNEVDAEENTPTSTTTDAP